jgi:hypothetical protein
MELPVVPMAVVAVAEMTAFSNMAEAEAEAQEVPMLTATLEATAASEVAVVAAVMAPIMPEMAALAAEEAVGTLLAQGALVVVEELVMMESMAITWRNPAVSPEVRATAAPSTTVRSDTSWEGVGQASAGRFS